MKEIESTHPTPEQLLTILEGQLALKRQSRAASRKSRTSFLVVGVMLIMIGTAVALVVLQQLLERREDSLQSSSSIPSLGVR